MQIIHSMKAINIGLAISMEENIIKLIIINLQATVSVTFVKIRILKDYRS